MRALSEIADGIADAQSLRPRERHLRYRHDRDSKLVGRRLGVDDDLSKPIDFEMLRVVVENRLRRANGRRAIILGLSDSTVNFHCDRAMKRLDVINRTQAVSTANWQGSIGI